MFCYNYCNKYCIVCEIKLFKFNFLCKTFYDWLKICWYAIVVTFKTRNVKVIHSHLNYFLNRKCIPGYIQFMYNMFCITDILKWNNSDIPFYPFNIFMGLKFVTCHMIYHYEILGYKPPLKNFHVLFIALSEIILSNVFILFLIHSNNCPLNLCRVPGPELTMWSELVSQISIDINGEDLSNFRQTSDILKNYLLFILNYIFC